MNVNNSLLSVLSMVLILLLFVSVASAADANATDVLSVDKSVNLENNNTLALDSSSNNAVSNDNKVVENDTWYVNASAPSGGNGKSPETAFNSLNDALINSELQDGNTIMIASGEYKGENNTGLEISKNLNFIKYGDGEAIFDAEIQRQIWSVTATSVNITGLTFKNGKYFTDNTTEDSGGAIYFENTGSVTNCIFTHNAGEFRGGAIYFENTGSVTNCTFTDNTVDGAGGAIYFENTGSNGSVTNCNFINNTATYGGALRMKSGSVTNCNFINNTASMGGGAISFKKGAITNCTFTSNKVTDNGVGGAISIGADGSSINNCAFVNNNANSGKAIFVYWGHQSNVENNWWGSNNPNLGELIYNNPVPSVYAVLNLTANPSEFASSEKSTITTKFIWNNANTDVTSSLPKRNIKLTTNGTLTETEGDVGLTSEFSATSEGIYYVNAAVDNQILGVNVEVNGSGLTHVTGTWYVNSSATGGDGKTPETAFRTLNDALTNSELQDGNTIMIASGEYKGTDNTGLSIITSLNFIKYGDGEAIFDAESQRQIWEVTATSANITGLTFKNGKEENGGAIYFESDASVTNCTFIHNNANRDGGAIYLKSGDVKFDKSTFTNNTAYEDGGAIYAENNVNIKNSTFENNKCGSNEEESVGGAIRSLDSVNVDNSTFIGNHAVDYGGAIYASAVYINASYFSNNDVDDDDGGAIYADYDVDCVDSIFNGNSADEDGGAIFAGKHVNIRNTTFESNRAYGASDQCYGGAIRSEGDVKVDNCTFYDNCAYDYGGAIYADTVTWVNDLPSYFIFNYVMDNCGGAIYTNKFETDVKYGVFINNEVLADDDGGAIYINNENWITFSHCYFENNYCGDEGGAIYLDSMYSHLTLKNNVFVGNVAGDKGNIVYNGGTYDKIEYNWFGKNDFDFDNELVEYHTWPIPDESHTDDHKLQAVMYIDENVTVGKEANLTIYFSNGNTPGDLFNIAATFSADNGAILSNWHTFSGSSYVTGITFTNTGVTHITGQVNNQDLELDVLPTVNDSQYRQKNASNSEDVVTNDEKLFALPNEVYELPRSLLNEPSEGLINSPNDEETFSLLNEPSEGLIDSLNNSYNVLVNNDYNVAIDSNVDNNGNTNLFSVISNVENTNHTNSTNKTPNNSSVAKTIGNQSNGNGFNYLWVLLLIVIFAGAGVLIKQYKN